MIMSNVDQVEPNLPNSSVVPPVVPPPPIASSEATPSSGSTMNPQDVTRVQKLCKFASSSLDYDDVDTAIKNLTEALDLLHKSKQT